MERPEISLKHEALMAVRQPLESPQNAWTSPGGAADFVHIQSSNDGGADVSMCFFVSNISYI